MRAVGRAPGVRQGISAPQLRLTVLRGAAAVHVAGLQEVPYPRQETLMLHTLILPVMADCFVSINQSINLYFLSLGLTGESTDNIWESNIY